MERLNSILQPHIRASKIRLSYIEELLPDLKSNEYIVLHKNVPNIQLTEYKNRQKSFNKFQQYSTGDDIGGSPLEYSFGNCEFDDTVVATERYWRKEEELYLPLTRVDACNALNLCLEHFDCDNSSLSILALCDGKDSKHSRLIGSIIRDDWFTTLEGISIRATTLATIRSKCHGIIEEHLKKSFAQEHDIEISMLNNFDLFGIKEERIDWDKAVKSDFQGSINIEIYSNSLILDTRLSNNILIAQINAGWKDSPLKELRDQLFLLSQYLSIIDECEKNIGSQSSIKFTTSNLQERDVVIRKLNLLSNGYKNFKKSDDNSNVSAGETNHTNEKSTEIDVKLLERVRNISSRHDIDFTDLLWEVLTETSEYPQMINYYIEIILKEILEHKFVPQVNDTNSTRFIKHVFDLFGRETSHFLAGSVPLELFVDMGFEKLIRDYLHILRAAQFVDLYHVRQKFVDISSGIFATESYRKKLITLAQIHICLECMLLFETHLDCSIENLQSLFAHVYKEFVSEQSPLRHYNQLCSRFYTLTIPLPNTITNELNKVDPTVWRASLSSRSAASMVTTTTYYNKMPIFPTNIYPDDSNEKLEKAVVSGISVTSSSVKYKKITKDNGLTFQ